MFSVPHMPSEFPLKLISIRLALCLLVYMYILLVCVSVTKVNKGLIDREEKVPWDIKLIHILKSTRVEHHVPR